MEIAAGLLFVFAWFFAGGLGLGMAPQVEKMSTNQIGWLALGGPITLGVVVGLRIADRDPNP